jgi:hypothetical protein
VSLRLEDVLRFKVIDHLAGNKFWSVTYFNTKRTLCRCVKIFSDYTFGDKIQNQQSNVSILSMMIELQLSNILKLSKNNIQLKKVSSSHWAEIYMLLNLPSSNNPSFKTSIPLD